MDINQIKDVATKYKESLYRKGYNKAARYPAEEYADHFGRHAHLLWMIEEILNGNVDGEKAHRWIGFIQGVLWDDCYFTIEQMKDHNR
ncbi:MAG TPA: hypothetical protein VM577_18890 [Anaerovoracaceae bacterium]|nr:hypothetical protein [Anaerovoracaceae bacterium]